MPDETTRDMPDAAPAAFEVGASSLAPLAAANLARRVARRSSPVEVRVCEGGEAGVSPMKELRVRLIGLSLVVPTMLERALPEGERVTAAEAGAGAASASSAAWLARARWM